MQEKRERAFAGETKRAWNCYSRTLGRVTFANCRTSSSDLSSYAKQRISRWIRAEFRGSRMQLHPKGPRGYLVSPLPKRKRSLRLPCAQVEDACPDRQR